jgi:hypothetical protein
MIRKSIVFGIALALAAALAIPAAADTTGTWMGKVAYVNGAHIGVHAQAQTRDFLLPSDFTEVYSPSGKKRPRSALKSGMHVLVTYLQSGLFGSTRATRIDIQSALSSPLPIPTAAPPTP